MRPCVDRSYDGERLACRALSESVPPSRIVLARLPQSHPTRLAQAFRGFLPDAVRGVCEAPNRGWWRSRSRTVRPAKVNRQFTPDFEYHHHDYDPEAATR